MNIKEELSTLLKDSSIGRENKNYIVYQYKLIELIGVILMGSLSAGFVTYLLYEKIWLSIILGLIARQSHESFLI